MAKGHLTQSFIYGRVTVLSVSDPVIYSQKRIKQGKPSRSLRLAKKRAILKPNRSGPGSYKIFPTLEITYLIVEPDILDYTEETHCYYRLE